MRVCVLSSAHTAADTRVFHKEACSLARGGFRVAYCVPGASDGEAAGVAMLGVPLPRNRLSRMTFTMTRVLMKGLRWRAQIYHLQDIELVFAGLLLKCLGKTVVYDVHEDFGRDMLVKTYLPRGTSRIFGLLVDRLQSLIARTFDAIIPASEHIAQSFGGHKNVVVLHNYPLPARAGEPPHQTAKNEGVISLTYVGWISPERGLTQIVDALDKVRTHDVQLLLCGEASPPEYLAELQQRPGFARVEYLGFVPYNDVPAVMQRADAGIVCFLPVGQHTTAMPNKLFDYMGAGVPVIASDFPLWQRIVTEAGAGITVDPTDAEAIASAIEHLAANREQRLAMGRNGLQAARERYSWAHEERRLLALYDELAHRAPSRASRTPAVTQ